MSMGTIEEEFEFQVKEVFKQMKEDYETETAESGEDFGEWIWKNRKEFGEKMIIAINEQLDDINDLYESIKDED